MPFDQSWYIEKILLRKCLWKIFLELNLRCIDLSKYSESECEVVSDSLWPVDSSPPSSSVHGILQARILECVAISFSKVSILSGIKKNLFDIIKLSFSIHQDWKIPQRFCLARKRNFLQIHTNSKSPIFKMPNRNGSVVVSVFPWMAWPGSSREVVSLWNLISLHLLAFCAA